MNTAIRLYQAAAAKGHLKAKAALGRLGYGSFANPSYLRERNQDAATRQREVTRTELRKELDRKATNVRGTVLSVADKGVLVELDYDVKVEHSGLTGTDQSSIRYVFIWMASTEGVLTDQRVSVRVVQSEPYTYTTTGGGERTVPGLLSVEDAVTRLLRE